MDSIASMQMLYEPRTVSVASLPYSSSYTEWWGGEKFTGGLGAPKWIWKNYWELRARSVQLFEQNLYARGMIRRLVTNVIHNGLDLEATPEESVLGLEEGSLDNWTDLVEDHWRIWAMAPGRADAKRLRSFNALQAAIYLEALISGDVLVALIQDRNTGLPRIRVFDGALVQSPPFSSIRQGNRVDHGVELDGRGRQVAYWVLQDDNTYRRLPAWGEKSGRRLAWLVYGMERREHEVRGTPMLAIVTQSLQEIDRYRDSTQRKAVINSMLAMFIEKNEERMASRPFSNAGGAVKISEAVTTSDDGQPRSFAIQGQVPGMMIEELQVGEIPKAFGAQGTDEKFGDFEEAIVQAMAWHAEIPPEIMRLLFSSNYAASQGATNEFKMAVAMKRGGFADQFNKPVYQEWLVAAALSGRVAPEGVLDSYRDESRYDLFSAWLSSEWVGYVKPSVDIVKTAQGYSKLVEEGVMTRAEMTKEITGGKFKKKVRRLQRENAMLAEAREELEKVKRDAEHANAMKVAEVNASDAPGGNAAPPQRAAQPAK